VITSQQSIVVYDRGRAVPDRLTRGRHSHYLCLAAKMLAVYRTGAGCRTRRELHRSVEGIFADEPDCPSRRIAAFSKLLDDAGEFDSDPGGEAGRLRLEVFGLAAAHHPLVRTGDRLFEKGEAAVKAGIAAQLGRPWEEIEAGLYADVIDFQRLGSFAGFEGPEALLSAYNVAQLQACLYRAERMTVTATGGFKSILRHAKFARLLFEIRRLGPSHYRMDFSGPASVLSETRRYGVNFAKFIPALLACKGWQLRAEVRTPWNRTAVLELSD
jgi:predicted nuclease of restriction endonuclease-like RecB superfamily